MKDVTMKGMEDSGSLTVEPGRLLFEGKRKGRIEIIGMRSVSAQRAGRDFVNKWITIEYGNNQVAMFVDAGLLGWSGILGGNKRLLATIQEAAGTGSGA
jgi:hypothetical protein